MEDEEFDKQQAALQLAILVIFDGAKLDHSQRLTVLCHSLIGAIAASSNSETMADEGADIAHEILKANCATAYRKVFGTETVN